MLSNRRVNTSTPSRQARHQSPIEHIRQRCETQLLQDDIRHHSLDVRNQVQELLNHSHKADHIRQEPIRSRTLYDTLALQRLHDRDEVRLIDDSDCALYSWKIGERGEAAELPYVHDGKQLQDSKDLLGLTDEGEARDGFSYVGDCCVLDALEELREFGRDGRAIYLYSRQLVSDTIPELTSYPSKNGRASSDR